MSYLENLVYGARVPLPEDLGGGRIGRTARPYRPREPPRDDHLVEEGKDLVKNLLRSQRAWTSFLYALFLFIFTLDLQVDSHIQY